MNIAEDELAVLRAAREEIQRLRLGAQRELAMAKQLRAEAERYQREIETKARSQAQLLILQARLATKKEIAALKREVTEEIQKLLVDIRMLRIASQEELEAQRSYTNAARLCAMTYNLPGVAEESPQSEREAVSV